MGEAENENYANNASGVFIDLFSPGYGNVAPTEASPQERLPILREAFGSGSLAQDEGLRQFVPELTWRSGLSDRSAARVLRLAQEGFVDFDAFRNFAFGGVTGHISEDVFASWIEFLTAISSRKAASIALDLFHGYFVARQANRKLPETLTLKLLLYESLFGAPDAVHDQMEEYHWTEIATAFIDRYPDHQLELAASMFAHFGADGSILDGLNPQPLSVLSQIVTRKPHETWKIIVKYLGPPIDSRAFDIEHWLTGGRFFAEGFEGVLTLIPLEDIWQWVDADVDKRSWRLAHFVPKSLTREPGKVCLAREVLIRYGLRPEVRRNLMANFSTEGWTGPSSLHYQKKKATLLEFRKDELEENVRRWIDEYVENLDRHIERAKAAEERGEP